MKKTFGFICVLLAGTFADETGISMSFDQMRGVTFAYSYRPIVICDMDTKEFMFPTHVFMLNVDGWGQSYSSSQFTYTSYGYTFLGMGLVFGLSTTNQQMYVTAPDYYRYYRLTEIDRKRWDFTLLGVALREMIALPFTADLSVISSYVAITPEFGLLNLQYKGEVGAFNQYRQVDLSSIGGYLLVNASIKLWLFELYGGIGGLTSMYSKGADLTYKNVTIENAPYKPCHFLFDVGVSIVIDLFSMENLTK
jgi:hypothetical protein